MNTQDPNPYATPSFVDEFTNYGPVEMARKSLSRPATAIVIMASVHSVFESIILVNVVLTMLQGIGISVVIGSLLLAIPSFGLHVFQSICAAKMGRLESYRLAVTGCILSVIPGLSPLVYLGIPFAIWGIVLLRKPTIQQAFDAVRDEERSSQQASSNSAA